MFKTEIRPLAGFEGRFAEYTEEKAKIGESVEAEKEAEKALIDEKYAKILADKTAVYDKLIAATSEIVEIEIPDVAEEPVVEETIEESTEETVEEVKEDIGE